MSFRGVYGEPAASRTSSQLAAELSALWMPDKKSERSVLRAARFSPAGLFPLGLPGSTAHLWAMTDRKIFDLFYGARCVHGARGGRGYLAHAGQIRVRIGRGHFHSLIVHTKTITPREGDHDLCRRAYETGADINFAFDGRRSTKGGAGRWYYGDLQWYAPDGIDGDKEDTLLIIAVKNDSPKLVEWILSLDGLDAVRKNGKGLDAMGVAMSLKREHLLLGMPTTRGDEVATGATVKCDGVAAVNSGALPPPPGASAAGAAAAGDAKVEVARLRHAAKMLRVANDEKDAEIAKAKRDCDAYQELLKEKDASIGELQKSVLEKEKEVIVMLHKIGRLEEALSGFTDFRQADAEQYTGWGKAGYYNAEEGARGASGTGS